MQLSELSSFMRIHHEMKIECSVHHTSLSVMSVINTEKFAGPASAITLRSIPQSMFTFQATHSKCQSINISIRSECHQSILPVVRVLYP